MAALIYSPFCKVTLPLFPFKGGVYSSTHQTEAWPCNLSDQRGVSKCDATKGLHIGACPLLLMGTHPAPCEQVQARLMDEEWQHGKRIQAFCQGPSHMRPPNPPDPRQASQDKKTCTELWQYMSTVLRQQAFGLSFKQEKLTKVAAHKTFHKPLRSKMLGASGSSSLIRKLLISMTLDDKEVGAEWEWGGGVKTERERVVSNLPPWSSGQVDINFC